MSKAYKSFINVAKREIEKSKSKKSLEAGIHVRNKVVEKLNNTGTGKTYQVPGTNRTYTASSPGQPPAVLFGDLQKSIKWQQNKSETLVGSELEKAKHLEFGTRYMSPRPFLKPTFQEEQNNIKKILGKMWLK